jgi:DNA-3-methyladenine glycosylase
VAPKGLDDSFGFLHQPASTVAPRLLGCIMERTIGDETLRVKIVETEAYDQTDVASHSYRGESERSKTMFGPPGYLYVYFTYGMHYCCNIVTESKGFGSGVLIRAVEPLDMYPIMEKNRKGRTGAELTNGPAKLCQALDIDTSMNGHDLRRQPLMLIPQPTMASRSITTTTRIGISEGKDVPWRFYQTDSPFVSKRV